MTDSLKITSASADDVDHVAAMIRQSISENPKGFLREPAEKHADYVERLLEAHKQRKGGYLVGRVKDEIVAVGGLDPKHEGAKSPLDALPEIARLHVRTAMQGRGYGIAMVKALEALATEFGYQGVQLHVTKTQKAAIAVYQKQGFNVFRDHTSVMEDGQEFPTLYFRKVF